MKSKLNMILLISGYGGGYDNYYGGGVYGGNYGQVHLLILLMNSWLTLNVMQICLADGAAAVANMEGAGKARNKSYDAHPQRIPTSELNSNSLYT